MQEHQPVTIVDIAVPRASVSLRGTEALVCRITANSQLKDARINSDRSIPAKTRVTRDLEGRSRTEFVLWASSTFHVLVDELHIMLESLDTVVGCVLYSRSASFRAFTTQENTFIEVVYSRKVNSVHHALITIASGQTVHVETSAQ